MNGLLLTMTEVLPEHEAEFNRWYGDEHLPLLRPFDGVLAARRFRARAGTPRYIALYDLAYERAPASPGWRAAIETPWSRRIDELTRGCEWILKTYTRYGRT